MLRSSCWEITISSSLSHYVASRWYTLIANKICCNLILGQGPFALLSNPRCETFPDPGIVAYLSSWVHIANTALLVLQISFSFSIDRNIRDKMSLQIQILSPDALNCSLYSWWIDQFGARINSRIRFTSNIPCVKKLVNSLFDPKCWNSQLQKCLTPPIILWLRKLCWAENTNWLIWPLPAQRGDFQDWYLPDN